MTTVVSTKNNRKLFLTSAGVLAFGLAAYGLGRVYPPMGPSEGTVAPADRYVSAQVTDADVTLGDTAVPELMQTDAFQVMVKDPNFRALASDPGFAALASNQAAMAAIAANPAQFAKLAQNPSQFHNLVQSASQLSANSANGRPPRASPGSTISCAAACRAGACTCSKAAPAPARPPSPPSS